MVDSSEGWLACGVCEQTGNVSNSMRELCSDVGGQNNGVVRNSHGEVVGTSENISC